MEGNPVEPFREELRKFSKATDELLRSKYPIIRISEDDFAEAEKCIDLSKERGKLSSQLEELKKENFSLRTSLKAWHLTLKNKLNELDEADLMLNKTYSKIWSGREEFCSRAEKFIEERGLLPEWWQRQKKLVSDLGSYEKERLEEKKSEFKRQKVGEEERVLKHARESGTEGRGEQKADIERDLPGDGVRDGDWRREFSRESPKRLKEQESEEKEETDGCRSEIRLTNNQLFSFVDLEKVRKANRLKQRRRSQHKRQ